MGADDLDCEPWHDHVMLPVRLSLRFGLPIGSKRARRVRSRSFRSSNWIPVAYRQGIGM